MRRAGMGLGLLVLAWALVPTAEYLFRSRTDLLIDQLLGRGCQFQEPAAGTHTLNPLTAYGVRHPEFACPLWAAAHLAALPHTAADRARVLAALDAAGRLQPATFDTGDGVILYAAGLDAARARLLAAR